MIYIWKTGRTSETFLTAYSYSLSVKSNWNSFKKYAFLFTFAHMYSYTQLVKKQKKQKKQNKNNNKNKSSITTITNPAFLLLGMVNVLILFLLYVRPFWYPFLVV